MRRSDGFQELTSRSAPQTALTVSSNATNVPYSSPGANGRAVSSLLMRASLSKFLIDETGFSK